MRRAKLPLAGQNWWTLQRQGVLLAHLAHAGRTKRAEELIADIQIEMNGASGAEAEMRAVGAAADVLGSEKLRQSCLSLAQKITQRTAG